MVFFKDVNFLREKLESVYLQYNKREYIDPDPLLFLYDYTERQDIEIAGFIAACLAYGRVDQIMKTIRLVLDKLNPSPFEYLIQRTEQDIAYDFKGFKYRFARDVHITNLLSGIKDILNCFSSIEDCFYSGWSSDDETFVSGLSFLYDQIKKNHGSGPGHLLADPKKNSACKRSHLFLRWMIRNDNVDPGIWKKLDSSRLIVPLDTHMYRIGIMLGFTERKSRDIKTALEITKGFREILREDPVKYDFCLTRFGIRQGLEMTELANFFMMRTDHDHWFMANE